MKKVISNLLVLTIVVVLASCKKYGDTGTPFTPTPLTITAEKTQGIKRGEPVFIKFEGSYGAPGTWTVSPKEGVFFDSTATGTTFYFEAAGTYLVSVKSGSLTASQSVNVIDSFFRPEFNIKPGYTKASLAGDEIILSLDALTDKNKKTYVRIDAQSKNQYGCQSYKLDDSLNAVGSANTEFYYRNLLVPNISACTAGSATAKASPRIFTVTDNNVHSFTVELNSKKYTGSYVRTADGTVTFTWPYTSGVTMSPLVLPE